MLSVARPLAAQLLLSLIVVRAADEVDILPSGGLVSIRRSVDTSIVNTTCHFSGNVVFGGPSSLQENKKYYFLSHRQQLAYQLVMDAVNTQRCGVKIDGQHYKIEMQTYDDRSNTDVTTAIGQRLTEAPYTSNASSNSIDLIVAGFSSAMTRPLADVVANYNLNAQNTTQKPRLMLAGGSSVTNIFANRSHVFTTTPPALNFLVPAIHGLSTHTNAKTIATIWEDVNFPVLACGTVPKLAKEFGMEVLAQTQVEQSPNTTVLQPVAAEYKELDPDVVITCTYACDPWILAMRSVNWSPRAQVFTICLGSNEFVEAVGSDAEYVMGVAPWHASVQAQDAVTGWTTQQFAQNYQALSSDHVVQYQATTAAAIVSIAVQAMEAVDSVDNATLLVEYLSNHTFPTMFGDISFDENGQNAAPMLLLQHDADGEVQTTFPSDKASGPILYPMPTWDGRDCQRISECVLRHGGVCTRHGYCECPASKQSVGVGASANCISPWERASGITLSAWAITGIAVACLLVIPIVAFIIIRNKRLKEEKDWIISKGEVHFTDAPPVIGRGTFGIVVLGEYRGTEVAVKYVSPPQFSNEKSMDISGGSGGTTATNGTTSGHVRPSIKEDAVRLSAALRNSMKNEEAKLPATSSRRKLKRNFIREMRHLSKLRHPNVATIMGAVFNRGEEPMLVMEYMGRRSLHDLLNNKSMMLDGEIMLPIIRDIAQGMRFLHASKPAHVHGDLKAGNVLVDSKFHAKVADFGLSQKIASGMASGTPFWMAPELLRGESPSSPASDVYAYGITLYEAYSRKDPYEGESIEAVLELVADSKINMRPPVPKDCPPLIEGLMSDCMVENADERPTFEEISMRLKRMDVSKAETAQSQGRSSISLFDIFPKHIAEALRDGREVESEHRECVTIFFSDIVGFTDISSKLEARKVANMLDRLYTHFDRLSEEEDIFKVETIGDAYMAVTNLIKDQDGDHVARIARFAGRAINAANETLIDLDDPSKGHVNIRVGFHSGPVVADVVGTRNPRFCLFGDTVNTAARMESSSMANRIQCSQAAAKLLRKQNPAMEIQGRGLQQIKGKGAMKTFWIRCNRASIPMLSLPSLSNFSQQHLDISESHSPDRENEDLLLLRLTDSGVSQDSSEPEQSPEQSPVQSPLSNITSPASKKVTNGPALDRFTDEEQGQHARDLDALEAGRAEQSDICSTRSKTGSFDFYFL